MFGAVIEQTNTWTYQALLMKWAEPRRVWHKRFFAFEQCDSARAKQKIANVLKMWFSPEQLPLFCRKN